jgi:hypothetical protein
MRNIQKVALVMALGPLFLLVGSNPAMASSNFPGIFNTVYPASQSANNASTPRANSATLPQLRN